MYKPDQEKVTNNFVSQKRKRLTITVTGDQIGDVIHALKHVLKLVKEGNEDAFKFDKSESYIFNIEEK